MDYEEPTRSERLSQSIIRIVQSSSNMKFVDNCMNLFHANDVHELQHHVANRIHLALTSSKSAKQKFANAKIAQQKMDQMVPDIDNTQRGSLADFTPEKGHHGHHMSDFSPASARPPHSPRLQDLEICSYNGMGPPEEMETDFTPVLNSTLLVEGRYVDHHAEDGFSPSSNVDKRADFSRDLDCSKVSDNDEPILNFERAVDSPFSDTQFSPFLSDSPFPSQATQSEHSVPGPQSPELNLTWLSASLGRSSRREKEPTDEYENGFDSNIPSSSGSAGIRRSASSGEASRNFEPLDELTQRTSTLSVARARRCLNTSFLIVGDENMDDESG